MKKLLLLPLVLAVCALDFGASAAVRAGRGKVAANNGDVPAANNAGGGTTKAVRSASRGVAGPVKQNAGGNSTATNNNAAAPTTGKAVRSASRGVAGPVKQNAGGNKTNSQGVAAPKASGARAASTQNVLKAGTKVSTATANTAVPQECQDVFFGCMDAFCMLDNEVGGRCQCNDRSVELAKVSADIMKVAEQAMTLASEGVERIQMGENADEITARAKAAADAVAKKEEKKQQTEVAAKKRKSLDLSSFNMNMFADDDDDIFEETAKEDTAVVDFLSKTGDELYTATAKMCAPKLPEQCKTYSTLLQGIYQQKIRSDCSAYANALESKKSEAQQKLLAAQQALREAAAESFESENKYDYGQCMVAFKQCIQTTGDCGSDFSGCIADNSTLDVLYGKAKTTAKKGKKAAEDAAATISFGSFTFSKATYSIIESKALMCDTVVKQCINANGGTKDVLSGKVFEGFLKNAAPQIYATEYQMASDSRMNCISTIVKCVKKACKSEGMEEGSDNYDACLSNPDSVKNYCALEIPKCGDSMSEQNVIDYVMAKLASDRVDACTEEVRTCLQKEDHCGENYANCIGLDTDTILDFCPAESLMACQDKHNADKAEVRNYVAKIAQGLALSIDNAQQEACQKAVDDAMIKWCGDTLTCSNVKISDNIFSDIMKVEYCKRGTTQCYDDLLTINDDDIIDGQVVPRVTGRVDLSRLSLNDAFLTSTDDTNNKYTVFDLSESTQYADTDGYITDKKILDSVQNAINDIYKAKLMQIESEPKVAACINGKTFSGISTSDASEVLGSTKGRFPHMTQNSRAAIATYLKDSVWTNYDAILNKMYASEKLTTMENDLHERVRNAIQKKLMQGENVDLSNLTGEDAQAALEELEKVQDTLNSEECMAANKPADFSRQVPHISTKQITADYDSETNVCNLTVDTYQCKKYLKISYACREWDMEKPVDTKKLTHQMTKATLSKDVKKDKKATLRKVLEDLK